MAAVVGLLSGAGVAACGDADDSGTSGSSSVPGTSTPESSTTTATTTATTTTIDVTPYLPMLLDVDVVNAWAVESGVGGDDPVAWDDPNPVNEADLNDAVGTPCDDTGLNPTIVERLRPVTGHQFEPVYSATQNPYQHLIEFLAVGDPTRLGMDMEAMRGAFEGCPENPTWNGAPVSITPLELPESTPAGPLGDQRYAFTVWAMPGMDAGMGAGAGAGMGMGMGAGMGTGTGPGTGTDTGYQWGSGDPARIMAPPGVGAVWYVRTAAIRVEGVMITVSLTEIVEVQVPASGIVPTPVPTVTDEQFVALVARAVSLLYT